MDKKILELAFVLGGENCCMVPVGELKELVSSVKEVLGADSIDLSPLDEVMRMAECLGPDCAVMVEQEILRTMVDSLAAAAAEGVVFMLEKAGMGEGGSPNVWNVDDEVEVVIHPGRILVSRAVFDALGSESIRNFNGLPNAEILVIEDDKFRLMDHAEKVRALMDCEHGSDERIECRCEPHYACEAVKHLEKITAAYRDVFDRGVIHNEKTMAAMKCWMPEAYKIIMNDISLNKEGKKPIG